MLAWRWIRGGGRLPQLQRQRGPLFFEYKYKEESYALLHVGQSQLHLRPGKRFNDCAFCPQIPKIIPNISRLRQRASCSLMQGNRRSRVQITLASFRSCAFGYCSASIGGYEAEYHHLPGVDSLSSGSGITVRLERLTGLCERCNGGRAAVWRTHLCATNR